MPETLGWKERIAHVQNLGLTTPKTSLTAVNSIVLESFQTYQKYLQEYNLEFDRNEYMVLANGWREGLRAIKADIIPDVTSFYNFAEAKRDEIRMEKMQKQQQTEWHKAVQRCEVILDAVSHLSESDPEFAQDVQDTAELLKENIQRNQTITPSQDEKLSRLETKIVTKFSEMD